MSTYHQTSTDFRVAVDDRLHGKWADFLSISQYKQLVCSSSVKPRVWLRWMRLVEVFVAQLIDVRESMEDSLE